MSARTSMKLKILLLSSFVGVILALLSVFLILRLDYVVNNTLYAYGLRFDYAWAEQYWVRIRYALGLLGMAVVVNCIIVAYVQFSEHYRASARALSIVFLLSVGAIALIVALILLTQTDVIVNTDLYRYGLQFSSQWANQYWAFLRLTLGLVASTAIINVFSAGYVLAPRTIRRAPETLITPLLIISGGIAISASLAYESSISAFIGLTLVFWGAIMFYIRPTGKSRNRILATMILPPLLDLDQMVKNLGYKGKAVYLPPKYLSDFESNKVYISARENEQVPTPENVKHQDHNMFLKEPDGLLLSPSGTELSRLLERKLGKSFVTADLGFLEVNMPKLFVEVLEMARKFTFEARDSNVFVRIEGFVYNDIYREIEDKPYGSSLGVLGGPVDSAIACALTKATGKPVVIERELVSKDGQTIEIEYSLLQEMSRK